MYQQLLYQTADKINNTLQNNGIDPILTSITVIVAGVIVGTAAYFIKGVFEERKLLSETRKYKTS